MSQGEKLPLGMTEEEPSFKRIKAGEVLDGKWRIEKKIGEGGMGTVWLADDLQLGRKVAVKLLAPVYAQDQELITRFEREARLTAGLEHPNIVPVYGVGHLENRPFIVMKNLEGMTLASLIRDRGSIKREELLAILEQIASGLDFIHRKNFIHRDIKSGNIFVSPDGHATILDFGILRSAGGTDALTRTGIVMGTPHYMAPEQALGHREVDHRADLYALGIVTYEAMSGTLPFDGGSDLSTVQLQAHSPPPDLCARAPWVPGKVASVVYKALSKSPPDRYPTAAQFVQALDDAFAGKKPAAPPSSDLELPSRVSRRRTRTLALSLTLALVAFIGGAALALWPERPSQLRTDDPLSELPIPAVIDAGALVELSPDASVGFQAELSAQGGADAGELSVAASDTDEEVADAGVAATTVIQTALDAGVASGSKRPAKTTGRLNVISSFRGEPYWASVMVDGAKVGNTPLTLELAVGRHVVRVERAGFKPVEKRILVASGRSDVLRIALKQ